MFTVLSYSMRGQTVVDSTGMELFNRGLKHYQSGNLDSSLVIWKKIVDEKIGVRYDTYGNAFYNIGSLYVQMKNYEKAKEWYKKILASDLRDNDETGSLMEPHTNYKHKSAKILARLYAFDSNFTEALGWIYKADTVYRYWGFEGSASNVSNVQSGLLASKAELLKRLKRPNEAVRVIVTELICTSHQGFFAAPEDTLLTLIDKKTFKAEFDKAINNVNIVKVNENNWVASFPMNGLTYTFPISNVYPDRNIPHYWSVYFIDEKTAPTKQQIINSIMEKNFYKRLSQ